MKVSAVIVTRGDVDLEPILASFDEVDRIDDVVVWDNSAGLDVATWGRHLALLQTCHRVVYSQDDDLVHAPAGIDRILDAYQPGVLTGCMWDEWSAGAKAQGIAGGYDDLAFPGSGSVYDREVPLVAAARYLAHYPEDAFFRLWCDAIIGTIAPTKNIDERFTTLPAARNGRRMANLPGAAGDKRTAIERARALVGGASSPKIGGHAEYMAELDARLARGRRP